MVIKAIIYRRKEDIFLIVMIATTWLPYVFIGRIMFMYHYFPVLPFVMLTIVSLMKSINKKIKHSYIMIAYILIIIVLFAVFYPITSGMTVNREYVNSLKWLNTWYF